MHRKGKWLTLILLMLVAMLFQLTGCEDTAGPTPTPTQPAATEAPTPTGIPDLFPTLEDADLKYVYYVTQEQYDARLAANPDDIDAIYEAKKAFEAKYGGKFEIIGVPWAEIVSKIVAMQAADDAPDLMLLSDQTFPLVAAKDIIQPLDETIDQSWVNPLYLDAFTFNGTKYAIGVGRPTISYIAYNKTMFELEGLPDPYEQWKNGEWNFDAFYNAGSKLTKDTNNDGTMDQWGFCTWGTYVSQLIQANGARLVDFQPEGAVSTLKDSKTIEALTFIQKMLKMPGGFMNPANYTTFQQDFITGKLAMTMGVYFPKPVDMKDDMGAVPFPYGPSSDKDHVHAQVFGYAAPTGSDNQKGMYAFLYLLEKESTMNPKYETIGRKNFGDYYDMLFKTDFQYEYSNDRNFADVWTVYWNIANDLLNGIPPATVAETYDPVVQAALDKSYGG